MWKKITNFPNYEISNCGLVRNTATCRNIKNTRTVQGYFRVGLSSEKVKNKKLLVHRLVGQHFIPNPKNKPEINHIDGDKLNNLSSNLEWSTSSENQIHAYENKLQVPKCGKKHHASKISESDVRKIRLFGVIGIKQKRIAVRFGINQQNVSLICRKRAWKHI